jgi:hypothetical protein
MVVVNDQTPWGRAQHVTRVEPGRPGIQFVSTAGHGGFFLDEPRHLEVLSLFPEAAKTNGPWYEEDCDWCLVILAFPPEGDETHEMEVAWAVETAQGMLASAERSIKGRDLAYSEALKRTWAPVIHWLTSTTRGKLASDRAEAFRESVKDKWRAGGGGSPPKGSPPKSWTGHLRRGRDGATQTVLFKEYPAKAYYTDEELAEATIEQVIVNQAGWERINA